ncbi:MAG: PIN domain protein [Chitinophagales bacterium]|nr:PIN domain protein [Chitinophagales bacterium]
MNFKRITLYVDTSVIGGYFDIEFAKETQALFDNLANSRYDIMYSSVTEDELLNAPKQVRDLLETIPNNLKRRVELTEEVVKLADTYITENVVGKTSREDCFHIALATINKADVLVSWNFKHIVNILRIRGYNAVNLKLGYAQIDIRSPKDIVNYEE